MAVDEDSLLSEALEIIDTLSDAVLQQHQLRIEAILRRSKSTAEKDRPLST